MTECLQATSNCQRGDFLSLPVGRPCSCAKRRQNTTKYNHIFEQNTTNERGSWERTDITPVSPIDGKNSLRCFAGYLEFLVVQLFKNSYIHISQIPAEPCFQNTGLWTKAFYVTTLFALLQLRSVHVRKYEYGAFMEWYLEGKLKNSEIILS
jgi:hypothetical protein